MKSLQRHAVVSLMFLYTFVVPGRGQDVQPKPVDAQPKGPIVKSLADVHPGTPKGAVLTGLASDYDLLKEDLGAASDLDVWYVASKTERIARGALSEHAEIDFFQGVTFSVKSNLLRTDSPDAMRFVDMLQSVIYDSANPPTSADAADVNARNMANAKAFSNTDVQLTPTQTAAGEKIQMEIWKLNNQRFGLAQIGASQSHNHVGDERTLSIAINGRNFEIAIVSIPGSQPMVSLYEFKQ
jgi:hypothetical protein